MLTKIVVYGCGLWQAVVDRHIIGQAIFVSNTFINNAGPKLAKNQANAKQHSEAEPLLFKNYSHSSCKLLFKNNRIYSNDEAKEQVWLYSYD